MVEIKTHGNASEIKTDGNALESSIKIQRWALMRYL